MKFLNKQSKPFNLDFKVAGEYNRVVFAPAGSGMSAGNEFMINLDQTAKAVSLNPYPALKNEPDFAIDFLVLLAGEEIAESVKAKAKEVMLFVAAAKENVNLLDLVDAFDQVPELREFADRLRKAALPGATSKYFNPDEYHNSASTEKISDEKQISFY